MKDQVEELRARYRQVHDGPDTHVEVWLTMAFVEISAAAEVCGVRRFAQGPERHALAQHARLAIGKAAATVLEALDALEREEGLDGPLSERVLTSVEARELMGRLVAQAREEAG